MGHWSTVYVTPQVPYRTNNFVYILLWNQMFRPVFDHRHIALSRTNNSKLLALVTVTFRMTQFRMGLYAPYSRRSP